MVYYCRLLDTVGIFYRPLYGVWTSFVVDAQPPLEVQFPSGASFLTGLYVDQYGQPRKRIKMPCHCSGLAPGTCIQTRVSSSLSLCMVDVQCTFNSFPLLLCYLPQSNCLRFFFSSLPYNCQHQTLINLPLISVHMRPRGFNFRLMILFDIQLSYTSIRPTLYASSFIYSRPIYPSVTTNSLHFRQWRS